MYIYELDTETWLPHPRAEVFSFFARADSLERITPPWFHLEVLAPGPAEPDAGAAIDYRLRVHGLPLRWRREITAWEPPFLFVDEQRRGPFALWHHTHTFLARDGGTLLRDRVRYALPLGRLTHRWLVQRDVEELFAFRAEALRRIFPAEAARATASRAGAVPRLRLIAGGR